MLGPPLLPRTLEASVRDLTSDRAAMRVSAVQDLVRHARSEEAVRTQAVELLVARLGDDHPQVRGAVAVALGDLEARDAVTALLVALEDDDAHVRQMAINALGEIGDERALPRLRRALKDSRAEVRYQSVIAFARIADAQLARTDRAALAILDASEVDDVLAAAASDSDPAIAHIALRVAEERLDQGRPPDGRLLSHARTLASSPESSPHVALAAAILLAKTGDARGSDLVARVVRGERIGAEVPDKEDERAAVELAGELGLTDLTGHLERRAWGVARFVKDTCPFHARIALARMGHARAKREILAELASSRREVVEGAVVSAGRAALVEARETIVQLSPRVVDSELVKEAIGRLEKIPARP